MSDSVDSYFPVAEASLRYRDEGSGPPIVFVHGWTLDLDMWAPQVADLRLHYRLIRWDRRGFGLSGWHPGIATDVEDIRALCHHLDIQHAVFVGMSQGARVVCALAAARPSLVAGLVFDGSPDLTGSPGLTANDIPLDQFRILAREHGIAAFRRAWLAHPMAQLRTRDRSANELLAMMVDRYQATDLLRNPGPSGGQAGATTDAELDAIVAARIPALVINGELDLQSRKDAGRALAKSLPGSQYTSIAAAGHLPNLDNPAAYNAALRSFLSRKS